MDTKTKVDAAAWLAVLISAREKNDFATAAKAQAELARIGVKVTLAKPRGRHDGRR